ncbi:MAG: RND family efflux transporter MFP subunit, partial [Myxococcota bacterium]
MLIFLFIVGCSAPDEAPSPGPPPAAVIVAPVREGQLSEDWTLPAEVRALERAELASGALGAVVRVTAREGDAVAAGVVLVEVDSRLAAAELSAARAEARRLQADLAQAERTLARLMRVDAGVLAASEIEQAEALITALRAATDGASAQAQVAEAQLARHRVTSPFSGIVAERHVDTGDWVTA